MNVNPLYIVFIIVGILVFAAPIVVYCFILLHPKYEKKSPDFTLELSKSVEHPTDYIDSCETSGDRIKLGCNRTASFKVILFKSNGKPFKVISVICNEVAKPCWIKLPKGASGIAFVERTPKGLISFDIEMWKLFVLPLGFAIGAVAGLFFIGYGSCGIEYDKAPTSYFLYPAPLAYVLLAVAGAVAYALGVICIGLNYLHLNKKEEK